jgi:hypothetical protein
MASLLKTPLFVRLNVALLTEPPDQQWEVVVVVVTLQSPNVASALLATGRRLPIVTLGDAMTTRPATISVSPSAMPYVISKAIVRFTRLYTLVCANAFTMKPSICGHIPPRTDDALAEMAIGHRWVQIKLINRLDGAALKAVFHAGLKRLDPSLPSPATRPSVAAAAA